MEHHIVKSFDEQLDKLNDIIARMGGLAEVQLATAIQSLTERDSDLATKVMNNDSQVDAYEASLNEEVVKTLALRSPVADDLRLVISALKVSADLERVADHAANAAKRALVLNQMPPVPPLRAVARLGWLVLDLLKDVIDAYLAHDADKAIQVWQRDSEVDDLYSSLFRELLTYMMEDPRTITACTHLLFVAKNIERVGDHATNIAEMVHYTVKGTSLSDNRPKRDVTSFLGRKDG